MHQPRPIFVRLLLVVAGLLVLKVTLSVVLGYRDYFPPNFGSDFLRGRQTYFFGAYQWAFYAHIISGPLTLLLGLILVSERFRTRFPRWHRTLGKTQVALVVLLLTPSGLWMARYALTGPVAAAGFATLAIATAACVLFGWRSAVKRQFTVHRRWMWRMFLLLCSAVVLRVIGGLTTVMNSSVTWTYPLAAWISWLAPLAAFEISQVWRRRPRNRAALSEIRHSAVSVASLALPPKEISARN